MRGYNRLFVEEARRMAEAPEAAGRVSCIDGVLTVRVAARSDKPKTFEIDLASTWLPPTLWAETGTKLKERTDLLQLISNAVAVYLRRTGESKSTSVVVHSIVNTLCKFVEYGWLHHCYAASDWTPARAARLVDDLAKGGWQQALDLKERVERWAGGADVQQLESAVNRDGGLREDFLREQLQTNAAGRELSCATGVIKVFLSGRTVKERQYTSRSDDGMSQTMLRQCLSWINLLADVPEGLPFTPYENVFKASHDLGRPSGRTKNITPGEVGTLLKEGFAWVYGHSALIIALFEQLATALEREQISIADRESFVAAELRDSAIRERIEDALGVRVAAARTRASLSNEVTLQMLGQGVFDASFVVIGFMNARRSDEIQHPQIGIYHDALAIFDERLGLYECDFYLEKYRKDYKKFFVNGATVAAIKVLQRSAEVAARLRVCGGLPTGAGATPQENKITLIPRFTYHNRNSKAPEWFRFNAGPSGQSRFFFKRAFPEPIGWHLRPHMLRRAYALIYYYRYEDSELLALSLQLDHFSVDVTGHYLNEASVPDGRVTLSAYGRLTEKEKQMLDLEDGSVERELEAVHREKLHAFVSAAISTTDATMGGLGKLMRRFHAKLLMRLDYSGLAQHQQSETLTAMLEDRGHRLRPFRHGDCGAPAESSGKTLSRCFDREQNAIDRSKAGAELCHNCAYHRASAGHVLGLKQELHWMKGGLSSSPAGSLMYKKLSADIANLANVIAFYESRLEA